MSPSEVPNEEIAQAIDTTIQQAAEPVKVQTGHISLAFNRLHVQPAPHSSRIEPLSSCMSMPHSCSITEGARTPLGCTIALYGRVLAGR